MLQAALETIYSLLQSPQFRAVLAVWWLLPCAIQDQRSATVSPLLTVPAFVAAWPVALLAGGLWPGLALVAFVFVLTAALFKPTDARMATGLTALCGFGGFVIYLVVQLAAFRLVKIVRNEQKLGLIGGYVDGDGDVHLPAGLWFYVAALVWFGLSSSILPSEMCIALNSRAASDRHLRNSVWLAEPAGAQASLGLQAPSSPCGDAGHLSPESSALYTVRN